MIIHISGDSAQMSSELTVCHNIGQRLKIIKLICCINALLRKTIGLQIYKKTIGSNGCKLHQLSCDDQIHFHNCYNVFELYMYHRSTRVTCLSFPCLIAYFVMTYLSNLSYISLSWPFRVINRYCPSPSGALRPATNVN